MAEPLEHNVCDSCATDCNNLLVFRPPNGDDELFVCKSCWDELDDERDWREDNEEHYTKFHPGLMGLTGLSVWDF